MRSAARCLTASRDNCILAGGGVAGRSTAEAQFFGYLQSHLLKVAEVFVLAQLVEVVDRLGVVEAVVVVDLAVACQLTELSRQHTTIHHRSRSHRLLRGRRYLFTVSVYSALLFFYAVETSFPNLTAKKREKFSPFMTLILGTCGFAVRKLGRDKPPCLNMQPRGDFVHKLSTVENGGVSPPGDGDEN